MPQYRFHKANEGAIALAFALIAPVLLAAAGCCIDLWRLNDARDKLQTIADSSALAGAQEYVVGLNRDRIAKTVAEEGADRLLAIQSEILNAAVDVRPVRAAARKKRLGRR